MLDNLLNSLVLALIVLLAVGSAVVDSHRDVDSVPLQWSVMVGADADVPAVPLPSRVVQLPTVVVVAKRLAPTTVAFN